MSTCSKHIPRLVGHPLSNWTNHLRYYPTSILVRTNHDSAMRRTFDFDRVSSLSSRSATLISQHLGNLVVRKQTGVTSSSRSQVGGGGGGKEWILRQILPRYYRFASSRWVMLLDWTFIPIAVFLLALMTKFIGDLAYTWKCTFAFPSLY